MKITLPKSSVFASFTTAVAAAPGSRPTLEAFMKRLPKKRPSQNRILAFPTIYSHSEGQAARE